MRLNLYKPFPIMPLIFSSRHPHTMSAMSTRKEVLRASPLSKGAPSPIIQGAQRGWLSMFLTRRAFAGGAAGLTGVFVGLVPLAVLEPARAHTARGEEVSFRWRVPTAHYETVKDSLVFDGEIEEERDTKGLLLVLVFIGVAQLPSLVDAILTLRRNLVQPGLVIDARGAEIKIDADPTLPRATILLVDNSGAKLYQPGQLTDPAELTKVLASAMSK